jgi:hypothetical protein
MPSSLLNSIISKIFPRFKRHLSRTVTMPATTSLVSTHTAQRTPPNSKSVPYISFNTTVGHNSDFKNLTNQQLEELGGLEYRALNVLLWIVGAVSISLLSWRARFECFKVFYRFSSSRGYYHYALYVPAPMEEYFRTTSSGTTHHTRMVRHFTWSN